jgi:hypothetical protein
MPFTPSEKIVFFNLAYERHLEPSDVDDVYWQGAYKRIVEVVARNHVGGHHEFSAPQYVEQWHHANYEMINLAAKGHKTRVVTECQPSSSSPDYSLDETLRTLMALAQSGAAVDYVHSITICGVRALVSARTLSDPMGHAGGVPLILTVTASNSEAPVT